MPQVDVAGITLNYEDTGGTGTPILLIHAFPLDSRMWQGQIKSLGGRFRLIAPDLKGFGASDAPSDAGSYSMDSYADELKGLLDHLGLQEAVVVGLSLGGYVVFALLRRHPQVIKALVLADTRAEADAPEGIEKRTAQQKQVESDGTAGLIEALPNALLSDATRSKKPDVVRRARELMDNPPQGFIGALEAMKNRPDSTETLSRIEVPTLVMVGENDTLTPPDAARKIHDRVKGSSLVVLPEAGHLSNLEAPDAFNGALAGFLNDL